MRKLAALLPLMLAAFAPQQPPADGAPKTPTTRKMTASVTDYVRAQLISNRCWTDHSDMVDAARLRATFRVYIGPDGRFEKPPQLVAPVTTPLNDPQLQLFITSAKAALDKCDAIGWIMPKEYFDIAGPTPYIDITFVPKVGSP